MFHTSLNLKEKPEKTLSDDVKDGDEMQGSEQIYGYVDGHRDKNADGLLYLGMIKLPEDLKESYKLFCKSMLLNFHHYLQF